MTVKALFSTPQHDTHRYEVRNEVFSAITHGIGFGLAVAGLILLINRAI